MIQAKASPFALAALPYAVDALAPVISAETVRFHYDKHHRAYVDKLNELVSGTEWQELELEELIVRTSGRADQRGIFNNAGQVWNHNFYWNSLSPQGGGRPTGELAQKIEAGFGSFDNCLKKFVEAGTAHFGSGWVWLVEDRGTLKIIPTPNAESPLSQGSGKALLVLDVWEHAYYLDFQNRRKEYLEMILSKLINWNFAKMNLAIPN